MSDTKPNNPQVFPITEEITVAGRTVMHTHGGLTLREYFAGQVVAGIVAQGPAPSGSPAFVARAAYLIADAMLKAREET